jgi:C_GCAxxG_C_C family probable redox protein
MEDVVLKLMKFKARGYCCAQMMLLLGLENQGKTNVDLIRTMGGLCFGINAGEVCGALTGGACLISLYAGKGSDEEDLHSRYMAMIVELVDWFKEATNQYGGIRCDDILGKFPDKSVCGLIVNDTYGKCMDILVSQGFDPAAGKN